MTNHDPNTTDFPGPREHPRLAQALRDLSSPAPGALDDRVLQPMRAPGRRRWLLGATVGVAAMLALGAGVILLMPQPTVGPRAGQQFAMDVPSRPTADAVTTRSRAALGTRKAGDALEDRRPDVLDAFALARRIDQSTALSGDDLSGDGRVDDSDVQVLMARIVRLPARETTGG